MIIHIYGGDNFRSLCWWQLLPQTPDDGRGALDYVRYRYATFHIELNVRGMENWPA